MLLHAAAADNPLLAPLRRLQPALPVGVAYSGGADSTALLLACNERWPAQVMALHVHHGLQAAADDFERHAQAVCQALGLPLQVAHVDARHQRGESPEQQARQVRYRALAELAQRHRAGAVLLAQHADDQVETLLLALSRGAGLPGLAAMPARFERHGVVFHRPGLQVSASQIRTWLAAHGQGFVQDPSNADERFTRNRIRARLLPALQAAFPQFRQTFARSAGHAAQAQELLDEVAQADLARSGNPPVIAALQALSPARLANVLRYWLKSSHACQPSQAQLSELMRQIMACRTRGHHICLKIGSGFIERNGALLHWYNRAPLAHPQAPSRVLSWP